MEPSTQQNPNQKKSVSEIEEITTIDKRKKIIYIISTICLGLVFLFIVFSIANYMKNADRILKVSGEIENALVSKNGANAYIQLKEGVDVNNILSIKFIFLDKKGGEHIYETLNSPSDISMSNEFSFFDMITYFSKNPLYEKSYDYNIGAQEIGLKNFLDIREVSALINKKQTNGTTTPVNTTVPTNTTTNRTTGGSGGSNGGSSNGNGNSCTPKTCSDYYGLQCGTLPTNCNGNTIDCNNNCGSGKSCIDTNCISNTDLGNESNSNYSYLYSYASQYDIQQFEVVVSGYSSETNLFILYNNISRSSWVLYFNGTSTSVTAGGSTINVTNGTNKIMTQIYIPTGSMNRLCEDSNNICNVTISGASNKFLISIHNISNSVSISNQNVSGTSSCYGVLMSHSTNYLVMFCTQRNTNSVSYIIPGSGTTVQNYVTRLIPNAAYNVSCGTTSKYQSSANGVLSFNCNTGQTVTINYEASGGSASSSGLGSMSVFARFWGWLKGLFGA
jgi:hypothetical protein